jgi:DNA mismatch endonuclease (patch repair protein)
MKLSGRIGVIRKGSTDCYSVAERSYVMSRIHSFGNRTTELRFVRLCRRHGIKGWRRGSSLFGKPDLVFARCRLAIFIDGDFWHGNPKSQRVPKSNAEYWAKKIQSNRRRDRLVNRTLKEQGWRVFRVWESQLRRDGEAIMAKLRLLV